MSRPPAKPKLISPRAVVYKSRIPASDIEALASKLEGPLGKAILDAFLKQQDTVDMEKLVAALEAGDVNGVIALLSLDEALDAFHGVTAVLQGGIYGAGAAAALSIAPKLSGVVFRFNQLNPNLLRYIQTYSLGLIRQINDGTKQGIREALHTGIADGVNPKQMATQIKGVIGLTDRQAKAVLNYRRELETFHERRSAKGFGLGSEIDRVNGTQVFKPGEDGTPKDGIDQRRLRDFRYDGQMKNAMESGKALTPAQIDKMVKAYERKYLAYRARTIARTEAIRATNTGTQQAWQQALDKGTVSEALVRKKWVVAHDERTCSVCAPIPKMNPAKGIMHSAAFKTPEGPTLLPPIHPNCRCTVVYRQYEPEQLQDEEG